MTADDHKTVSSSQSRLTKALDNRGFRHGYLAQHLKSFLAQQIRALRGDMRQEEFGQLIGKPQSVVSRLEKQADRQISVQTLIDIAGKLDIAVIIRFVDFPTFMAITKDSSDAVLAPKPYAAALSATPPHIGSNTSGASSASTGTIITLRPPPLKPTNDNTTRFESIAAATST